MRGISCNSNLLSHRMYTEPYPRYAGTVSIQRSSEGEIKDIPKFLLSLLKSSLVYSGFLATSTKSIAGISSLISDITSIQVLLPVHFAPEIYLLFHCPPLHLRQKLYRQLSSSILPMHTHIYLQYCKQ